MDKGQFEKIRFWGKIFGTEKNYYVAEAEQSSDDAADDDEGNADEAHRADEQKDLDDEELDGEDDPLPKSGFKPPPVVPKEERGTGVNRFTYYVCNHRESKRNERVFSSDDLRLQPARPGSSCRTSRRRKSFTRV